MGRGGGGVGRVVISNMATRDRVIWTSGDRDAKTDSSGGIPRNDNFMGRIRAEKGGKQ